MKKILLGIWLCLAAGHVRAQVLHRGDHILATEIKQSAKKYKLLYVYCGWCKYSVERYPRVASMVEGHADIAFYPISAQDSVEADGYMRKYGIRYPLYVIDQGRRRKMIDLHNPIDVVCKYLTREFGFDTSRMGGSDFVLLDKDNHVLMQTDWDMNTDESLRRLKEYITP